MLDGMGTLALLRIEAAADDRLPPLRQGLVKGERRFRPFGSRCLRVRVDGLWRSSFGSTSYSHARRRLVLGGLPRRPEDKPPRQDPKGKGHGNGADQNDGEYSNRLFPWTIFC